MIREIPALDMPKWLSEILKNPAGATFQLENILQDSLYYPGSYLDATPVNYLTGNIFSFVYTDKNISRDDFLNYLDGSGEGDVFNNYRLIHEDDLDLHDITPRGWPPNKFKQYFEFTEKRPLDCYWSVWKRNEGVAKDVGPEGFSFFYAFSEMSELYEGLYNGLSIAPKILTLIGPGYMGEGSSPEDEDSLLKKVVVSSNNDLPDYLLYGLYGGTRGFADACWSEYQGEKIVQLPERHAGLWKLNP
jgi:hypothetical protein